MTEPSDADAIRRLAADLEIRNVVARLAQTADTGEVSEYIALFTTDAVWEMPDNPSTGLAGSARQGHDDIATGVHERRGLGVQGPGSGTMHVITTISVEIHDDDNATARSYFLYYGTTSSAPTLLSMGRYHDAMRRTPTGWKLAHRTVLYG
jgi:3-phenylpropionate/cinnamic acid dioxygenase small subunit